MSAGAVPVGPGQHGVDLLALAVALAGPVPLATIVAGTSAPPEGSPYAHRLLALLVAWCLFQSAVAVLLGAVGHLDLPAALTLEVILGLAGAIMAGGFPARPSGVPPPSAGSRPALIDRALQATLVAGAGALLVKLGRTAISDYDSLAYHGPAIATWYQHASLTELEGFGALARYPFGWELLGTLFVLPFREDWLLALPNLIAWGILGLSIVCASMAVGAPRTGALAVALVTLTMPSIRHHVVTLHVDLALAAFFTAGLYFVLHHRRAPSLGTRALLLAALALIVGVKTSGLVYAVLLLGAHAWSRPARTGIDPPGRGGRAANGLLLAAAVCVGLVWYVRNALAIGNPLGDVRVELGGAILLPGTMSAAHVRRTTLAHCFDLRSLAHWRILLTEAWRAFGPGLLLLGASAAAWRWRGTAEGRERPAIALVAWLLLATAAVYWFTPYGADNGNRQWQITPWIGQNLRFAFPFVAILAVMAARSTMWHGEAGWVAAVAVLTFGIVTMWDKALRTGVALTGAGWVVWRLTAGDRRAAAALGAALVAFVVVAGSLALRVRHDLDRRQHYGPIAEFLERHVPPEEPIGYLMSHRSYVLFGRSLRRTVVPAPATNDDPDAWSRALRRRGIGLLAVGPLRPQWSGRPELSWLADRRRFTPVFGRDPGREIVLYRVNDERDGT